MAPNPLQSTPTKANNVNEVVNNWQQSSLTAHAMNIHIYVLLLYRYIFVAVFFSLQQIESKY